MRRSGVQMPKAAPSVSLCHEPDADTLPMSLSCPWLQVRAHCYGPGHEDVARVPGRPAQLENRDAALGRRRSSSSRAGVLTLREDDTRGTDQPSHGSGTYEPGYGAH